jgi:hypothetical protein
MRRLRTRSRVPMPRQRESIAYTASVEPVTGRWLQPSQLRGGKEGT